MKLLNDLMLVPPGGWRWTCEQHNVTFRADFFPELLEKVTAYLVANKMVVPDNPSAWLQSQLCSQQNWGSETCHEVKI